MPWLHFRSACLLRRMSMHLIYCKACTMPPTSYTNDSGDLEITVQFLIQVDKLVQILESPVFTCMFPFLMVLTVDLRLQLLEPEKYPYLFKCLYGLLMLLPQSSAFATLRNRLNSISPIGYLHLFPRPYALRLTQLTPQCSRTLLPS
jgi:hypothetical protein